MLADYHRGRRDVLTREVERVVDTGCHEHTNEKARHGIQVSARS